MDISELNYKLLDIENKGNVIRLYFGKAELDDWYGDDWDDAPFDSNCGIVYDKFVTLIVEYGISLDYNVCTPSYEDYFIDRNEFKKGKYPLFIVGKSDWFLDISLLDKEPKDYTAFYMGQSLASVHGQLSLVYGAKLIDVIV